MNLVPSAPPPGAPELGPADVYSFVLRLVLARIAEDAAGGPGGGAPGAARAAGGRETQAQAAAAAAAARGGPGLAAAYRSLRAAEGSAVGPSAAALRESPAAAARASASAAAAASASATGASPLRLAEDAAAATLEGDAGAAARTAAARFLLGRVDRRVIKQTVMTSVYGVTYIGAREQVLARLREKVRRGRGERGVGGARARRSSL